MHRRACADCSGRSSLPDMAAEIHQSVARRAAILRIIGESTVRNQDELVKVLRKRGLRAPLSQASSRDLRELGVAKAGDRYILPAQRRRRPTTNPLAAVAEVRARDQDRRHSLTVAEDRRPARRRAWPSPSTARTGPRWSAPSRAMTRFSSPPMSPRIRRSCANAFAESSASERIGPRRSAGRLSTTQPDYLLE